MDLSFLLHSRPYPYRAKLFPFLGQLFGSSIAPSILAVILQEKHYPRWERAFTHISASPENYERVEFVGDALEGAAFAEMIQERFPSVRAEGPLTDFVAYYLGKDFLTKFVATFQYNGVKVQDLIWVDSNILPHTRVMFLEDIWEAIIGTLFEVGQIEGPLIVQISVGYNLVANFVRTVFNTVDIDPGLIKNGFSKNFRMKARELNLYYRVEAPKDILPRVAYILVRRTDLPPEILSLVLKPDRYKALQEIARRQKKDVKEPVIPDEWAIIGTGTKPTVIAAIEDASEEALNRVLINMKPTSKLSEVNGLILELQRIVGDFQFKHKDLKDVSGGRYTFLETTVQGKQIYLATYYSKTNTAVDEVRKYLLETSLAKIKAHRK